MPLTRKQKTRARLSIEVNILFNYESMDTMLGENISNSIEKKLENVINISVVTQMETISTHMETCPTHREISSQKSGIKTNR